jgi:ELWxxDGT repeat protein
MRIVDRSVPAMAALVLLSPLIISVPEVGVGVAFTPPAVQLIKDIRSGPAGARAHRLVILGDRLFFAANDGIHGSELWSSDGTRTGTAMVKDIWPGPAGSSIRRLTDVGGTLYFRARDPSHGWELWKSDGTGPGTLLVKDIRPGTGDSSFSNFAAIGSTLYFAAGPCTTIDCDPNSLWSSDGTEAGTALVKRFPRQAQLLKVVGTTLYFSADDGVHGLELWKSDGTEAGTVMVKDIIPGEFGSQPNGLAALGGALYFAASGSSNNTLWRSDGTEAGTLMISDVEACCSPLRAAGGLLYFQGDGNTGGYELWRSDGTAPGTFMAKDIAPGEAGSFPEDLTDVGGTLYFTTDVSQIESESPFALWKSDGTETGTVMVKDISASYLRDVGNGLYFDGYESQFGAELWRSDGTSVGTVMVADLNAGRASSSPRGMCDFRGAVFFNAYTPETGRELWSFLPQ